MQNSLERLLGGMAATMADEVAPALADPYLRAQAATAAELLRTLAPRIVWDLHATMPWADALRELATDALDAVGDELEACAALVAAPDADPERAQSAHLAALAELAGRGDALPGDLPARVRALVDEQAENERALLRAARSVPPNGGR